MLLLVAVGLVLTTAGCDYGVLRIRQNQVPLSGCKVGSSVTLHNPQGVLDISVGKGYVLYPLLENTLRDVVTGIHGSGDNSLALRGFQVTLDLQGMELVYPMTEISPEQLSFWVPTSGTLPPQGLVAGMARVVPGWLSLQMRRVIKPNSTVGGWPMIYAKVVAVALTTDEAEVESPEFVFPIEICNGCLVERYYTCPSTYWIKTNTCGLPQDEPVTCCWEWYDYHCFQQQ